MANEVTKIVAQKRAGRYNIYIDGHYAFPVSESVLIKFQITHGMEITPELEQAMLSADDVARAYQRALNYLSQQLRTEKEVHDKLVTEEIPEDVIEATMAKLREMHLVDDAEYAAAYVRTMKNTGDKGPRVIRQNLRLKGIGEQLIEDALTEYPADELLETASGLVAKLDRRYQRQAFKTKVQKIRQGLMTKGFSGETIDAAIEAADLQPDEDDEWAGLSKIGEKLWQRNRRYAYRERLMRTKRGLFQKGYDTDDINRFMDQLSTENPAD